MSRNACSQRGRKFIRVRSNSIGRLFEELEFWCVAFSSSVEEPLVLFRSRHSVRLMNRRIFFLVFPLCRIQRVIMVSLAQCTASRRCRCRQRSAWFFPLSNYSRWLREKKQELAFVDRNISKEKKNFQLLHSFFLVSSDERTIELNWTIESMAFHSDHHARAAYFPTYSSSSSSSTRSDLHVSVTHFSFFFFFLSKLFCFLLFLLQSPVKQKHPWLEYINQPMTDQIKDELIDSNMNETSPIDEHRSELLYSHGPNGMSSTYENTNKHRVSNGMLH